MEEIIHIMNFWNIPVNFKTLIEFLKNNIQTCSDMDTAFLTTKLDCLVRVLQGDVHLKTHLLTSSEVWFPTATFDCSHVEYPKFEKENCHT